MAVAFVGGGDRSLMTEYSPALREIAVHAHQLRSSLLFDNTYAGLYLRQLMGAEYGLMDEEEILALQASGQTDDMAFWPSRDSLRIMGDTAVIRLPSPEGSD